MKLIEFIKEYSDEHQCKLKFKELRETVGIVCRKCDNTKHYWVNSTSQYKCSNCGSRQSLKSGTMLEYSKLPYQYWFIAMHLLTSTKKGFSANEIQRQLGHKRYEPIWAMLHKIRTVMGQRDMEYTLEGQVEADEAFFEIAYPANAPTKAGRGSEAKQTVLVMASTREIEPEKWKKGRPRSSCGYVKMHTIENLRTKTIESKLHQHVGRLSKLITDGADAYNMTIADYLDHIVVEGTPEEQCEQLPWVHISIANAKRKLLDIHHCVSSKYIQKYLDEFCYKLNRRLMKRDPMVNLLKHAVSYRVKGSLPSCG
jgi:DNA-directed RNA polymerase subunit RPC12/RpoP